MIQSALLYLLLRALCTFVPTLPNQRHAIPLPVQFTSFFIPDISADSTEPPALDLPTLPSIQWHGEVILNFPLRTSQTPGAGSSGSSSSGEAGGEGGGSSDGGGPATPGAGGDEGEHAAGLRELARRACGAG